MRIKCLKRAGQTARETCARPRIGPVHAGLGERCQVWRGPRLLAVFRPHSPFRTACSPHASGITGCGLDTARDEAGVLSSWGRQPRQLISRKTETGTMEEINPQDRDQREKKQHERGMGVQNWLNHFAAHLKLTQHCKSTICQ